ncbi:MAG: AMP-binding protein, partial [Planctomycetota bacterium]
LFGATIRKRLGSPDFVVVGGAKPNLDAMAFLEVMGVRCLQGWGMTETTGPLAVCDLRDRFNGAFGTCGTLFPRTGARIEEGELIVEGPQIAKGYVEPDGTLRPFNGSKRTGDTALFDGSGRLRVTGKASDRITTDNGLNYNPLPFEEYLKAMDLEKENAFEEIVVVGDAKPRLGVVFFPREGGNVEQAALETYANEIVTQFNRDRAVDERVGPWKLSAQSLIESGALGPSGKVVRKRVEASAESLYGGPTLS